jgi:hypothetical protein
MSTDWVSVALKDAGTDRRIKNVPNIFSAKI